MKQQYFVKLTNRLKYNAYFKDSVVVVVAVIIIIIIIIIIVIIIIIIIIIANIIQLYKCRSLRHV